MPGYLSGGLLFLIKRVLIYVGSDWFCSRILVVILDNQSSSNFYSNNNKKFVIIRIIDFLSAARWFCFQHYYKGNYTGNWSLNELCLDIILAISVTNHVLMFNIEQIFSIFQNLFNFFKFPLFWPRIFSYILTLYHSNSFKSQSPRL